MKHWKNEKGFTLIEIIAVLIILGILAAVAVPKFVNMQDESRRKAVTGAIATLKSQTVMDYSADLLKGDADATSWKNSVANNLPIGDFAGKYTVTNATGLATITVTSGPTWFDDMANNAENIAAKTDSFQLWVP